MTVGTPSVFDIGYLIVKDNDVLKCFALYDDALKYEKENHGVDILCMRRDMIPSFIEKDKFGLRINPNEIREAWRVNNMMNNIFQF